MTPTSTPSRPERIALVGSFAAVVIWSWIDPHDRFTWYLEALPAIVMIAALAFLWRNVPVTRVSSWLLWALAVMMLIGAHHTYSLVPWFDWLRDAFGLSRNHYDRVSHVLQGVTVAMVARELIRRVTPIRPGAMLILIVTLCALGVSAACELVEWTAAEIYGGGATAFLGMQGDVWDAQKDMALALTGALIAQFALRHLQERQLLAAPKR